MVTISVVGPPHIDNEADIANISANVGDNLDVEVYFCSRPPASASWIVTMEQGEFQFCLLNPTIKWRRKDYNHRHMPEIFFTRHG